MIPLWRSFVLPVVLGFFFLGLYLAFHLGVWRGVNVEVISEPARTLLARDHKGPYHKINDVIVSVEKWAAQNNVPCPRTFGQYLDDPGKTAEERLRSRGGCVVDPAGLPQELPEDLILSQLEAGRFVHAQFLGSPAIGPWRVYPRLKEFIKKEDLKTNDTTLEIYTVTGQNEMTTDYYVPIAD
jgi:AraC family transcriptional regulator